MNAFPVLQRRHSQGCIAGHPLDSYSVEQEETRRGWKKCDCRIWACGTLAGRFKRFGTKRRDWASARDALAPYLAAGSWDVVPTPPPPPSPERDKDRKCERPEPAPGTKIEDAIQTYLSELDEVRAADSTKKKYREVLGQLKRYSDDRGLRFLEEWKPAIVRQFRNSWDVLQSTKTGKMSLVKPFFELFVEDQILESNPARIKTRRNRAARVGEESENEPRNPFSDAEIERMLEACREFGRPRARRWARAGEARSLTGERSKNRPIVDISAYCDYHRKYTGEDLADFINLSRLTGLRISDVATFNADRLHPSGELKVRPTKNGVWVCTWIPEWVQEMIRRRAAIHGPLIFGRHTTANLHSITDGWRKKLIALWGTCGPWEQKPTHHRFRHTFIRVLLQHDVKLKTVAELVGDTEETVLRHYGQWMPERQANLTRQLREAFADTPRFHIG